MENFTKQPCRTGNGRMFMTSRSSFPSRAAETTHLHHGVPGAVLAQLPQPVDEALAGLAVDPAGLHHGLALLHQLEHTGRHQYHHVNQGWEVMRQRQHEGEVEAAPQVGVLTFSNRVSSSLTSFWTSSMSALKDSRKGPIRALGWVGEETFC